MKDDDLLHKWVNGTLSPEELSTFKSRPEYDSLEALHRNTADLKAPDFSEDAMLQEILKADKTSAQAPSTAKRVSLSNWMRYAAAACVLLVAGWYVWSSSGNEVIYQLAKGEKKEGQLPDGSSFVLNAESTLKYDPEQWEAKRDLQLNGEAFFKVKKGSRFTVNTRHGAVQVLGTEFNVRVRRNKLEVSCNSGRVAVVSRKGEVLIELNPNEVVRLLGGEITEKWTSTSGENSSWKDGISRFRNVPLQTVLTELERQYVIRIDAQGVDVDEMVTANFPHNNLDLALKACLDPLGIKYEKQGDGKLVLTK